MPALKPSQIAVAAAAVIALVLIATIGRGGDDEEKVSRAPEGSLKISFVYSPDKEKLMPPLIERFNSERKEVDGKQVFVEGSVVASGEAESKIARGRLEPVAWSPAASLWGRLLNFEADQPYAPRESPSIVRTPLVIAMWEPMARALGYPRRQLGFADVLRIATSNRGWAAYGKPQFGDFKLVHTNPDFSTSGLSAVVAEYYAATGKKEGLTERDIASRKVRSRVRAIERSIVHYGDTTLFIAEQMKRRGLGYASAVAMEEVTLVDFNRDRGSLPKLVAIYPSEGTFYSDNPFIALDAPWVSAEEREGAGLFQKFLEDEITPELAARFSFRSPKLDEKPVAPITKANGADPSQPKRVLGLPEPRVLNRAKLAWRLDRKPANVMLVFDTSGSMNQEQRLDHAKEGLAVFLREVSPQDRIGLTTFSDRIQELVAPAPFTRNRRRLETTARELVADGGTAVWDATAVAVDRIQGLANRHRINAVVVLTDGEDTDSSLNVDTVAERLERRGDASNLVRVYTIAYSASAAGAAQGLERIARASGGKAYEGDTDDIEALYKSISSFF
jgi:Ca-activated chloride channel family protein